MPSVFKLKKLLTESLNLQEILNYFLTLTETSNIIPDSKPLDVEAMNNNDTLKILIQVVEKMTSDFMKQVVHLSHPILYAVEAQYFYYGICGSSDIEIPIPLFYFSDIKKGFFALSSISKKTEMFRFSLAHLDKNKIPIMNNKTVAH